jgi:hypothetical protein
VIDAHNHLWGNWSSLDGIVEVMNEVGVDCYCDLTGNVSLEMRDGGYVVSPGEIDDFFINCANPHPNRFYCFTTATFAENLEYVGNLLDQNPNVHIDFSARMDELGRQPYSTRKFMIDYQDRIYFGTDLPVSAEMYRCYFRFLETYDENFIPPDYDGTFDRFRWRVHGLGLPDVVLRKIYHGNIMMIIPELNKR